MTPSRLLMPALLASLAVMGALTMGCSRANLAAASRSQLTQAVKPAEPVQTAAIPMQAAPIAAAAVVAAPVAAVPAQHGPMFAGAENTLDTSAGGPTAQPDGVVLSTHNLKVSKVKTPSDDHLPKWVPVKGRLSVVDSSDLAENLGLVPPGTTKKSEQPISVAEKLNEENAARAAKTDSMTQGSSWSYAKAGRVRNHR